MKTKLCILFASIAAAVCVLAADDPFERIGVIEVGGGLMWGPSESTNVVGYEIYAAETNSTNFALVGTSTNWVWRGDLTKALHGDRIVHIRAVAANGARSEPGDAGIVTFHAGIPAPPGRMQIYRVVMAAATNDVPPMPALPARGAN